MAERIFTLAEQRDCNLRTLSTLAKTSTKYLRWYVGMMEKEGRPLEEYCKSKLELQMREEEERDGNG